MMVAGSACDGLGVVEPVDDASAVFVVGMTLVDCSGDVISVRLANTIGNPIYLKKGTVVGSCHAVCYVKKGETGIPSGLGSLLPPHLEDLYNNSYTDLDSEQLEFQDVFSSSPNDLGRTSVTKHTGDARPICQTPRRLPLAKQENAQVEVDTMLKQGVIESSASAGSSPIVMVKKKDASTRFCVDYRLLNDLTRKDSSIATY